MTNEEAIKELKDASDRELKYGDTRYHHDEIVKRIEALDLAIKALEEQSNIHDKCKKCVEFSEYQPNDDWEEYSDKLWKEAYERGKAEALEQQASEDCISRADALAVIKKEKQGWEGSERYAIDECHSRIAELPSVKPSDDYNRGYNDGYADATQKFSAKPRQNKGFWIRGKDWSRGVGMGENYGYYYKCSKCGKVIQGGYTDADVEFCPKCGSENKCINIS